MLFTRTTPTVTPTPTIPAPPTAPAVKMVSVVSSASTVRSRPALTVALEAIKALVWFNDDVLSWFSNLEATLVSDCLLSIVEATSVKSSPVRS